MTARGRRRAIGLLVAVMAVGLGVRLVGLGSSFWVDEILTVTECVRRPFGELVTRYGSENHHPLYSLVARASALLLGESEVTVRLPAVLFGVASLAAVARLGSQVLGPTSGLLAALLLAVSRHHVWFSQNARGYTALLLFTTLATSELIVLLHAPRAPRRRAVVRYALFAALAVYTHLTAAFALLGHALVWVGVWRWPPSERMEPAVDVGPMPPPRATSAALRALVLGGVLGAALYLPMTSDLVRAFADRARQSDVAVVKVEPWTRPGWAIGELVRALGLGLPELIGGGVVALLGAIGLASLWNNGRRTFVLLHLAAVPPALAVLLLLERHLYPRFFFFLAGFAAITVVRGARISGGWIACHIPGCRERRARSFGIALALLVASGSALTLEQVYAHPKQDFTGARDFVESSAAAGDAKVAVGPAKVALPGYYAPSWKTADTAAELESLRAAAPATWVVYTLPDQLRAARPDVAALLERDFDVVRELPGSLGGGTVLVARSR